MKAKVNRGGGFRGVLNYMFGDGKEAELVGGNMSGHDPRSLAAEFGALRQLRPECERPVWHCSLSCPPGETLSHDQWRAVTQDFMRHMGLEDHAYVAVRHGDTEIDHVHVGGSRIGLDGSLWLGQFDVRKAIAATQRIERDHGLTLTPGLTDDADTAPEQRATNDGKRNPTQNEIEKSIRTGEAPARMRLQEIIASTFDSDQPRSIFAFIDQMEAAGVVALPNVAKTGRMNGFSFEIDGLPFKGSSLGKAYGWKALQEKGIDYDQDRDGAELVARADAIKRRIAEIDGGEPARAGAEDRPAGGRPDDDLAEVRRQPGGDGIDSGNGDGAPGDDSEIWTVGDPADDIGGLDPAEAGPEIPVDVAGSGDPYGGDDLASVADRVADLAAPADPTPRAGGNERVAGLPLTKAQKAKADAWERQHGALEAPKYRLTLTGRRDGLPTFNVGKGKGKDSAERFYDHNEVRDLIPYLSRKNLTGYDIYITPIDREQHFILIDDTTPEKVDAMRAAGFAPALVQQSSAGNVQAVLRAPREAKPQEQKAANALMVRLNQQFGDPKISGVIHPFRMAGFSNKKPGRGDVFTRIIDAAGVMCGKAADLLVVARQKLLGDREAARTRRKGPQERESVPEILPAARGPADARFDALLQRETAFAVSQGWTLNPSALDYRVAVAMIEDGYETEEIAGAMLRRSPDLESRHPDSSTYIERTIASAGRPSGRPDAIQAQEDPKGPA